MRLSKSGMLKYLKCPKDFYYDYEVGLRKGRPAPDPGSPLEIGSEVHKIFEDYYKVPEARTVEEPYYKNIFDILMEMPNAYKYDDHMKHFALFNQKQIVGHSQKGQDIRAKGVPGYIPEEMETTYYNETLNIIGIIDRVDKEENGYRVIDYKSGKDKPIITHKRDGTVQDNYFFELCYYAFLYELETKREVYDAGIYFSKANKFVTVVITEEDKEMALDKILLIKKLVEDKVYPEEPSYLCKWCDNAPICTVDFLEEY